MFSSFHPSKWPTISICPNSEDGPFDHGMKAVPARFLLYKDANFPSVIVLVSCAAVTSYHKPGSLKTLYSLAILEARSLKARRP